MLKFFKTLSIFTNGSLLEPVPVTVETVVVVFTVVACVMATVVVVIFVAVVLGLTVVIVVVTAAVGLLLIVVFTEVVVLFMVILLVGFPLLQPAVTSTILTQNDSIAK